MMKTNTCGLLRKDSMEVSPPPEECGGCHLPICAVLLHFRFAPTVKMFSFTNRHSVSSQNSPKMSSMGILEGNIILEEHAIKIEYLVRHIYSTE